MIRPEQLTTTVWVEIEHGALINLMYLAHVYVPPEPVAADNERGVEPGWYVVGIDMRGQTWSLTRPRDTREAALNLTEIVEGASPT